MYKKIDLGTYPIGSYEVRGSKEEDHEFHLLSDHLVT